jgi:hypothetical protein
MRGRAAAVALPALVVVALVTVVAIASTGSTPGGSDATRTPSQSLYDTVFTLGLIAVLLGGVLLLYGLAQRKAIAAEVASGRYRRTTVVTYLLTMAIVGAFFYFGLVRLRPEGSEADGDQELAFPGRTIVPRLPDEAETSYEPGISWLPVLVVGGLVVAGVLAYVLAERRAQRGREAGALLAEQLADALDVTLDDLRAEVDARKAIVAAYSRLERVLAANGAPRLASETADEYLLRVLHALAIDPAAIQRLTDLFTVAKFSPHEVDASMKAEAIDALEHVRDELRATAEAPPVASDGAPSPAGAPS